jgi:hypothetical protein
VTVQPTLRLVRGDAAPEEIAALLAVLSARAAPPPHGPAPAVQGGWADPATRLRIRHPVGPGAWRASGRPRPTA